MRVVLTGGDVCLRSVGGRVLAIDDPFAARCPANRANASPSVVMESATSVNDQPQLVIDGRVHEFLQARGIEFVALWLVERRGYCLERVFDVNVAEHVAPLPAPHPRKQGVRRIVPAWPVRFSTRSRG